MIDDTFLNSSFFPKLNLCTNLNSVGKYLEHCPAYLLDPSTAKSLADFQ